MCRLLKEEMDVTRLRGGTTVINEANGGQSAEEARRQRSREGRLIAIIIIVVVSWLITRMWTNTFDIFAKKVLRVGDNSLVANAIISAFFTIIVIWILLVVGIDDLFAA